MNKKNTFTDFIAVADQLVKDKYTSPNKLVITGASAGGLLMGAVTNMRPELFKAVLTKVPFVDVINTMLDASLPLTVPEYEEWGNPNEKPAFDYMYSYSPYDQLAAKSLSDDTGEDQFQRQPGNVLGAGKIRSQNAHAQNGYQSIAVENEHGRRTWWGVGTLRFSARHRLRLCVHVVAGGNW